MHFGSPEASSATSRVAVCVDQQELLPKILQRAPASEGTATQSGHSFSGPHTQLPARELCGQGCQRSAPQFGTAVKGHKGRLGETTRCDSHREIPLPVLLHLCRQGTSVGVKSCCCRHDAKERTCNRDCAGPSAFATPGPVSMGAPTLPLPGGVARDPGPGGLSSCATCAGACARLIGKSLCATLTEHEKI